MDQTLSASHVVCATIRKKKNTSRKSINSYRNPIRATVYHYSFTMATDIQKTPFVKQLAANGISQYFPFQITSTDGATRPANPRCSPSIPPHLPFRSTRTPPSRTPKALERSVLLHVDVRSSTDTTSTRIIPRRTRPCPPLRNHHPISKSVLADDAKRMDQYRCFEDGEIFVVDKTVFGYYF